MRNRALLHGARWAAALLLAAPLAAAQEPEREPRPRLRPELTPPPLRPGAGGGATDPQQELLELFRKVETRLREIDALLVDAGAGDTRRLGEVGPAGIDRLIQRSLEEGRQNLRDIDRIIEIAEQFGSQQSSSGGGQSQSGEEGQQGSPTQRGQQSTQRESTPEGPSGRESEGEQGEEGREGQDPRGEQPGGQEPQQRGTGRPEDGGPSDDEDPRNRPADDPPQGATQTPGARPDDSERWGDLPIKVRDVFRHGGSEELPPQYRDWIDSYYRRLQREGRR